MTESNENINSNKTAHQNDYIHELVNIYIIIIELGIYYYYYYDTKNIILILVMLIILMLYYYYYYYYYI